MSITTMIMAKRKAPAYDEESDGFRFTKTRKTKPTAQETVREDTTRILLPTSDTPIIRRNKELRQSMVNGERRRSSSGMRGRRASSLIDEGRSNALPHNDVASSNFYTIISPDLTEPRRMRLLLGWCAERAKPSTTSNQSEQAARVVQEELAQDLSVDPTLSDWFSRDAEEAPPSIFLRKKPHPRNVANIAKAKELELHLEKLKAERASWNTILSDPPPLKENESLSPLHPDLLSSPQRRLYEQFSSTTDIATPEEIQKRLQSISQNVEFSVDLLSHSVHAVDTTRQMADKIASQSLRSVASNLQQQDAISRKDGAGIDALDALRGLAKVLNSHK